MAEKEIVYKPVVDLSELPAQLQELQNQIDVMMGAQAFSTTPQVAQPFAAPAMGGFSQSISNSVSQAFQATTNANIDIANQIATANQAAQLGAYKFQNALQIQGLMQPFGNAIQPSLGMNAVNPTDFTEAGFFRSFFGRMGLGFDPNEEGMTRADYISAADDRLNSMEMFGNVAGTMAGLTAGTIAGSLTGNFALGIAADMAADFTIGAVPRFLNRHNAEQARLARYIKGSSTRFAGMPFTSDQALGAATNIQDIFDSREMQLMGIEQFQAENMVSTFTEAGGFDAVRTAEGYTQQVRSLLMTSQKVAQLLRTNLDDAVRTMGGLQSAGVTGDPTETLALVQGIEANAGVAGMTSAQFINAGYAGANMVQGTGIDFGVGFQGMLDANLTIRRGLANGAIDIDFIRHAGGQQQAAALINQAGYSYANSATGLALQAAGLPLGTDFNTMLSTAAGNIGGATDLLSLLGSRNSFIEDNGPNVMAMSRMQGILQMMDQLGYDTTNREHIRGFMMGGGFANSDVEVDAAFASVQYNPTENIGRSFSRERSVASKDKYGLWNRAKRQMWENWNSDWNIMKYYTTDLVNRRGNAGFMDWAADITGWSEADLSDMSFSADFVKDIEPGARLSDAAMDEMDDRFDELNGNGQLRRKFDALAKNQGYGSNFQMQIRTWDMPEDEIMDMFEDPNEGREFIAQRKRVAPAVEGARGAISRAARDRLSLDYKKTFAKYADMEFANADTQSLVNKLAGGKGTSEDVFNLIQNLGAQKNLDPSSPGGMLSRDGFLLYAQQSTDRDSIDTAVKDIENAALAVAGDLTPGSKSNEFGMDYSTRVNLSTGQAMALRNNELMEGLISTLENLGVLIDRKIPD